MPAFWTENIKREARFSFRESLPKPGKTGQARTAMEVRKGLGV